MTKFNEDRTEIVVLEDKFQTLTVPIKLPPEELKELEILYTKMDRHYVRWLNTGSRPTAKDDHDEFAKKFKEMLQKYG